MLKRTRRFVYRVGLRPRRGSIFFSPSLDFIYTMRDLRKKLAKRPKDHPMMKVKLVSRFHTKE